MSQETQHWDTKCIRERFTIVKTEITEINTGHKKLMVGAVIFCLILLLVATYISFEKPSGTVFLGTVIALVFISFILIFLIINSSEKCVSKLSICLLVLDDKHSFFKALSEVSCGGAAITHFLEFIDRATKIIEVVNPANSSQGNSPANTNSGNENNAK